MQKSKENIHNTQIDVQATKDLRNFAWEGEFRTGLVTIIFSVGGDIYNSSSDLKIAGASLAVTAGLDMIRRRFEKKLDKAQIGNNQIVDKL